MERHCIIGTAGHVDHGKTALIRALTGIDTDRLEEEKQRGITIELGFAYLDLPDGRRAGIVDVPGHEKFIKNMLAGVGGMDLVLLVIAADDGFMPQTREHLSILSLLNIHRGIIVITKTDLVDDEWLEIVKDDIRSQVQGSFLAEAPMVEVSSYTGQGIDELRNLIFDELSTASARDLSVPFRLPVDRVFSMDGFGTVVTGTLVEGRINDGSEVMVYPGEVTGRVRRIQVHNDTVKFAEAGQRVALNIAGLKKGDIERGCTVAMTGSMQNTLIMNTKITILHECTRPILTDSRLHFYHGTRDVLCKLILIDTDMLSAGQESFAQLRFTEPVSVKNGDRFVLRFYSPLETIGGGKILLSEAKKHKKSAEFPFERYSALDTGTDGEKLCAQVYLLSDRFLNEEENSKRFSLGPSAFKKLLPDFIASGEIIRLSTGSLLHRDYCLHIGRIAKDLLERYHADNPLEAGMPIEECRGKLFSGREQAAADAVLGTIADLGIIKLSGGIVSLPDFSIKFSPEQQKLTEAILNRLKTCGLEPPSVDDLMQQLSPKDKAMFKQVVKAMVQSGELVVISPTVMYHSSAYEQACKLLVDYCRNNTEILLGQFRDFIGTSRKYAIMLLELWDKQGITKKQGDIRILCENPFKKA